MIRSNKRDISQVIFEAHVDAFLWRFCSKKQTFLSQPQLEEHIGTAKIIGKSVVFAYFYDIMSLRINHIEEGSQALASRFDKHIPLSNGKQQLKSELIEKIGPWAFQSFPRSKWHSAPDNKIIEGALLRAKPEDKLMLLDLYSLNFIKEIWEQYVVIQDNFFHGANVWAAKHLFNQERPEDFVKRKYRKASLLNRLGKLL